jgi:hypothetical protein
MRARGWTRRIRGGWILAAVLAAGALAAVPRAAAQAAEAAAVEIQADKLVFDRESGWAEGTGNVRVQRGVDRLQADYVRLNLETSDAEAFGNVVLTRPEQVIRGETLRYNFRTRWCDADVLRGESAPFRWEAGAGDRTTNGVFVLHNAVITTCAMEPGHRHFQVRARRVRILPGEWLKASHAVWVFGRVPCFYVPYWYRGLRDRDSGFTFEPGYSSRWGGYLLTGYHYRLTPWLTAESHVDYRSRRGLAVGQDFAWQDAAGLNNGDLELYAADDSEPLDEDDDPASADIGNSRHRVRLRETLYLSPRDYILAQAYHVSDTDMLEDFFPREYRRIRQPENYAVYAHRGRAYSVRVQTRFRLNDFYTTLERLPQVSLDVYRLPLGRSGIYYEGEAAAAFLNKRWSVSSGLEDYDALRLDTRHRLLRPFKALGFLNLIPRLEYRGTWYGSTAPAGAEAGDPVLRHRVELGQEVSFKAFRSWLAVGAARRDYRHIVEPYADYTLVPEPNVLPAALLQFDRIDTLDEVHRLKLGLRNRLQTRVAEARARDLVDLDVYTYLKFVRPDGEELAEDVYVDGEFRPLRWLSLDVDGRYNVPDARVREVNTRAWISGGQTWWVGLEQRFLQENSNLWSLKATWRPNGNWQFHGYGRAELEDNRLEEVGGYVQRNLDCLSWRTGLGMLPGYTRTDGTEVEDEWRVTLQFWLTAFPGARIGMD